jgi:LysM repeat protein
VEGIRADSNVWLHGTLEQVTASLSGGGEADIKAVAGLAVVAFDRLEEPVISGFECREIDKKERSREPGMVGYVVQPEEELWDIAKKFCTTVEAITQVNQMETDDVKAGDALLLLKEA